MNNKKKVAFIFLLIFIALSSKLVYAFEPDSTAYYLHGKSVVVIVFVQWGSNTWSSQEKSAVLTKITEGLDWIEFITPEESNLGFVLDIKTATILYEPPDSSLAQYCAIYGTWMDDAVKSLGYNNADHMATSLKNSHNADNLVLLYIPKKAQSSSTPGFACADGMYDPLFPIIGERAAIYLRSDGKTPQDPYQYAHEILHLFGACDSYSGNCNCDECPLTYHTLKTKYPNKNCADCGDGLPTLMTAYTINIPLSNGLDYYSRGSVGLNDYDCDGVLDIFDENFGEQCYPPIPDISYYRLPKNYTAGLNETFTLKLEPANWGFTSPTCFISISLAPGLTFDSWFVKKDTGQDITFKSYLPGSAIKHRNGNTIISRYELLDIKIEPLEKGIRFGKIEIQVNLTGIQLGTHWIKMRETCHTQGRDYLVNYPTNGQLDQQGWETIIDYMQIKQKYCSDGTPYDSCSSIKPYYCEKGSLIPNCQDCGCPSDSTCEADGSCKPITQQCELGSGPCCDENGNYRPSNYICQEDIDEEYACAGINCGDDVLVRYQHRYCSGSASSCNGQTKWTPWDIADDCNMAELCVVGSPECGYAPECDVASNGNFYVSDYQNTKILKYSSTGVYIDQFESCLSPRDLAWDGNYLWQVDRSKKKLCFFDSDGTYQGQINLASSLERASGLTWDGEYFWISEDLDNQICKVDTNGNVLNCFSTNPPFASPRGLTWDGSYLWSTGLQNNIHKIFKLTKGGNVVASCSLPSGATVPYGLTFDGEDVWVTDWATDKVYQIDTIIGSDTCTVISSFDTIDRPSGLAFKPNTQCVYGECCDNGGNYRSTSYQCQDDVEVEYGCPWGSGCGADVGIRYKNRYCPGNNFVCTGQEVWEPWQVFDDCTEDEMCSNGQCVYSAECACECTSGPCCDGCYIKPQGAQPAGFNDYYDCSGENSPTETSYVRFNDYYCNGLDTDKHLTQTNVDRCDTCKYCEEGDSFCSYYDASTTCGSLDCNGLDTECRDYHDVNRYCAFWFGQCELGVCNNYTNMPEGTPCSNGTGECDGNGFCVVKLEGDINGDCRVDIFDLASVGLAYGSTPEDPNWNPNADLNNDGKINIFDLAEVGLNYGRECES